MHLYFGLPGQSEIPLRMDILCDESLTFSLFLPFGRCHPGISAAFGVDSNGSAAETSHQPLASLDTRREG
jgi:hypothetical protein